MTDRTGAGTTPFGPVPLTPTGFLGRAATVYGDRVAVVDGATTLTYRELHERSRRLAGALDARGAGPGAVVSVLAPNTHVMLEAHFGVPYAGAVLNTLNTRLSPPELAFIIGHAGAALLLVDHELEAVGRAALALLDDPPGVLVAGGDGGDGDGYEAALAGADPLERPTTDEMGLLAVNYTSGTTGRPKGVMYAHRGAYLQALAMAVHAGLDPSSVFLWTLPMFHCNGWCFPWAVTARGARHRALRRVDPAAIWDAVRNEGVTHLAAAPTVLSSLAHGPWADEGPAPSPVQVATGGAPPSPALLRRLEELNLRLTHLYGLTETYGPAVICEAQPGWADADPDERARLVARQGVANVVGEPVRVVDDDGRDVPADGQTMGEVLLRGNNVMLGYLHDPEATAEVARDGWFRTGDLGVLHPDGYVELRDRAKDVIISGGENISSIEVEQ
ncbi:MAG: AMP-binding protein, partial [Acidimicrobiia bacterium]